MGKLAAKLLGIWRRAPERVEPDATVESLTSDVQRMRAELADLQLQWAEVLDKLAAWGNRQAARDRQRVKQALAATQSDDELEPGPMGGGEQDRGSAGQPAPNGDGMLSKAELWQRARARGIR